MPYDPCIGQLSSRIATHRRTSPHNAVWRVGILTMVLLATSSAAVQASSLIVPDDVPTIQGAVDALPDTVFIRSGVYSETPLLHAEVAIIGLSSETSEWPKVGGLRIVPVWVPREYISIHAERIVFDAPVLVQNDNMPTLISFVACHMAAGITDISAYPITSGLLLRHCTVSGRALVKADGYCVVDSCTFRSEFVAGESNCHLEVRGSVFQGNGVGIGITTIGAGADVLSARISDTVVEGFSGGIILNAVQSIRIDGNIVRDCIGRGVYAFAEVTELTNNRLERCGFGMTAIAGDSLIVSGNAVGHCGDTGILALPGSRGEVSNNIVWSNQIDGIYVYADPFVMEMLVRNNTSCFNGGSGFLSHGSVNQVGLYDFTGNIGFANGRYGVDWDVPDAINVRCNDWFGNGLGAVEGLPPSSDDLFVDPLFCNAARGDFGLRAASPLLGLVGCETVGALGPGCRGPELGAFHAERVIDGIRVIWKLEEPWVASAVWLERAEGPDGPWARPTTVRGEDGLEVQERDQGVLPDHVYWYRIVFGQTEAPEVVAQPIKVDILPGSSFRLVSVGPSPSRGSVRIEFELSSRARVDIQVFDIQGRLVAAAASGSWTPGRHLVHWSGKGPDSKVVAGVYLIRYRFPGGQDARRVVLSP